MTTSLLTRLEQAQGGDRELDVRIECALAPLDYQYGHRAGSLRGSVVAYFDRSYDGRRQHCTYGAPRYTYDSIDSARLAARMKWPSCVFQIEDHPNHSKVYISLNRHVGDNVTASGIAKTLGLAASIAILRAHGGSNDA